MGFLMVRPIKRPLKNDHEFFSKTIKKPLKTIKNDNFWKIRIYFFIKKTYEKRTRIDFHFLMVF